MLIAALLFGFFVGSQSPIRVVYKSGQRLLSRELVAPQPRPANGIEKNQWLFTNQFISADAGQGSPLECEGDVGPIVGRGEKVLYTVDDLSNIRQWRGSGIPWFTSAFHGWLGQGRYIALAGKGSDNQRRWVTYGVVSTKDLSPVRFCGWTDEQNRIALMSSKEGLNIEYSSADGPRVASTTFFIGPAPADMGTFRLATAQKIPVVLSSGKRLVAELPLSALDVEFSTDAHWAIINRSILVNTRSGVAEHIPGGGAHFVTYTSPEGPAGGSAVHLNATEQRKVNVFMSNFSEVFQPDFSEQHPLSQAALLEFAIDHHWRNIDEHKNPLLSKAAAEEIVQRYFGRRLTLFKAIGRSHMQNGKINTDPEADGEEGYSSIVDGIWSIGGNRYYFHVGDIGDSGSFKFHEAEAEKRGGRFILLSYKTVPK